MIWRGVLSIVSGESQAIQTVNWTVSFALYAAVSWIVLFTFRLIFIAPYQLWKAEREARVEAEAKVNRHENRKNIRITLGNLLASGSLLMAQCMKEDVPFPVGEGDQWNGNVEGYLAEALDTSYVERFHTSAGIILTHIGPRSETHKKVWQALFVRCYRLQEFIKELSHD